MEWRETDIHFTGFTKCCSFPGIAGQLLWRGTATFHSGRKEEVFYSVPVVVFGNDAKEAIKELDRAYFKARKMMEFGLRGYLFNWLNGKRLRPVASVEWKHWTGASHAA